MSDHHNPDWLRVEIEHAPEFRVFIWAYGRRYRAVDMDLRPKQQEYLYDDVLNHYLTCPQELTLTLYPAPEPKPEPPKPKRRISTDLGLRRPK